MVPPPTVVCPPMVVPPKVVPPPKVAPPPKVVPPPAVVPTPAVLIIIDDRIPCPGASGNILIQGEILFLNLVITKYTK